VLPIGATFKNSFGKLKSVSKKQKIGRCFDLFFQNVKETRQKKSIIVIIIINWRLASTGGSRHTVSTFFKKRS
jgi:hypothetical protein